MASFTVVFADPKPETDFTWIGELAPARELELLAPADDSDEALLALLPRAQAIVTQRRRLTANLIAAAPNLRLVQHYGTRADLIDLDAARDAGVVVATMPMRGCIAVAELAMTLVLALSKNLVHAHEATATGAYRELGVEPIVTSQRQHKFQWMKLAGLLEIYGHTLGIIGFGEIGTEVSRRARAHGMNVIYNKRTRLDATVEQAEGVTFAAVDDLLAQSDFVLLSTPLTPQTEKLIGARELGLMKPSAFVVNICRGGVIDEDALVVALQEKRIAGAGLDVFVQEPIPYDHPLLALPNVILTPHIGGGTGGARDKQMNDVLVNILAWSTTEQLKYRVV